MFTEFSVDKSNQTYSDTLEAFGLAHVLAELMVRQGSRNRDVRVRDIGSYYQLDVHPGVDPDNLEILREKPIFPVKAIPTSQYDEETRPANIPLVDWDAVTAFFDAPKDNKPERPSHLDILTTINPEAIQGYNGLLFRLWQTRELQPELFSILLNLHQSKPNNKSKAIDDWKKLNKDGEWGIDAEITGQQLYNPDQGEGQNQPKANKLKTKDKKKINFWLTEWLRTIGFYQAAIPRLIVERNKSSIDCDRKIIVISPRDMTFAENGKIMNDFQQAMYPETHIQFDILAVTRYMKALLLYFTEPEQRERVRTLGRIKHTVVSGFDVAFYKKMGQRGRSVMNLSFIAFPGWVEVYSEEDARLYLDLLIELEKLARQFDESHSDAFTLLQYLRDFVSGDDLKAFFKFTNAFPAYLMGMRERGKYAHPLLTTFIERLMMSTDRKLSDVIQNEGFQNIAYAIRQSTVTAQYRKKQGDRKYDVRYGLGQELTRKSRYPADFITILSDFLHKFNSENAQVMETRPGPYRRSIKTTDIDQIVQLIDEFGSETVANLLIAYGYARVPREADFDEETLEEQEND